MDSTKISRLNYRIDMIENELTFKKNRLEVLVKELKESVAKYDTYSIVTFVPGRVREIEDLNREVRDLEEQLRIMHWIAKEEEDA